MDIPLQVLILFGGTFIISTFWGTVKDFCERMGQTDTACPVMPHRTGRAHLTLPHRHCQAAPLSCSRFAVQPPKGNSRPGSDGLISPLGISGAADAGCLLRTRPGGECRTKGNGGMVPAKDLGQAHSLEKEKSESKVEVYRCAGISGHGYAPPFCSPGVFTRKAGWPHPITKVPKSKRERRQKACFTNT